MEFEQTPKSMPAESGAYLEQEKIGEVINRVRDNFLKSIKGKEFTLYDVSAGNYQKVTATGNIDSLGYPFIKEKMINHFTIVDPKMLLKSTEGRAMVQELVNREKLSPAQAKAVMEKLGL